jgi:hypothetical protein
LIAPDNLHDYYDPRIIKLYKAAVESLPTTFDLKPENLKVFLSELDLRASCSGCKNMFDIQVDEDDDEEKASLLTEYGRISKAQVYNEVNIYIGEENRAIQDDN